MKRAVWRHIRSERSHITTPQEYSALTNSFAQTFKLNSLPRVRLINNLHFWMSNGKAVPQTHRVHCIQVSGADEVKVADTSNEIEKCFRVCRICNTNVTPPTNSTTEQDSPIEDNALPQLPALNLTIGLWVIMKYEGEDFQGR